MNFPLYQPRREPVIRNYRENFTNTTNPSTYNNYESSNNIKTRLQNDRRGIIIQETSYEPENSKTLKTKIQINVNKKYEKRYFFVLKKLGVKMPFKT